VQPVSRLRIEIITGMTAVAFVAAREIHVSASTGCVHG
jgi:hypothetical protein